MRSNINDLERRVKKLEQYQKKNIDDRPQKIVILEDDGSVFMEIPIRWTKWERN